ncbi:hypothetical protein BVRB_5g110710 [Beta vulgaris subsp. vulgaris]|nr:hypothetical protein BVRB_5g110710 [Beta vulgaris subsp. vulgaris]
MRQLFQGLSTPLLPLHSAIFGRILPQEIEFLPMEPNLVLPSSAFGLLPRYLCLWARIVPGMSRPLGIHTKRTIFEGKRKKMKMKMKIRG